MPIGSGAIGQDHMTFEHQYQFAWEHFKFHADQRTKMFRFFLLVIGLLLMAFSFLAKSDSDTAGSGYAQYSFLLLYAGGLLSTIFFGLDVRNTQLIKQSESILRWIETMWLFPEPVWYEQRKGQANPTKLGLLSRDALLKEYLQEKHPKKIWCSFDGYSSTTSSTSLPFDPFT